MATYESADADNFAAGSAKASPLSGPLPAVIAGAVLIAIGTALGLGLGIGLHSGDKSLIFITTTTLATTSTTTTTVSTTTAITTTVTTTTTTSTTTATTNTTNTTATTTTTASGGSATTSFQSLYSGSLSTASAVYGGVNQSTLNFTYETIQVVPTTNGTYTFTSASSSNLKLLGYLYNNSFIATNPSTNLLARDDSTTGSLQFNMSSTLEAGMEYILLVTNANQTAAEAFNVTATGPGNVTFTRRSTFSQTVTYGTVVNNATNDVSNSTVTINTNDVVTGIDGTSITGYVTQVAMSFFTAPTATTGIIFIYVLSRTGTTLVFTPSTSYQIPGTSIAATTGVQTFSIPRNQLPVVTGQYVGVGLGTGGGSLHLVPNVPEAYLVVSNFSGVTANTYIADAAGTAFLFRVFTAAAVVG